MFSKFTSLTTALALGAAGVIFSAQPAAAGAVEFFKCTLAEGKTINDAVSVASHLLAVMDEAGVGDYKVSFLNPLFSSDISRGTFYWVGHSPDVAAIGAANDFWISDANKAVLDEWNAITSDCETSSLYFSTKVE